MAKKIFTIGDIPVFVEAESVEEALQLLGIAVDSIVEFGPKLVYEIESEIVECTVEKSKLN